ncbi:MAG: Uma2 family endonuclease [Phycisphaerae bacterium]
MQSFTGRAGVLTAEDLWKMGSDGKFLELHYGLLYPVSPSGMRHGFIAAELATELHAFVQSRNLGHVLPFVGFITTRDPDSVLGPDIAFITQDQSPPKEKRDFFVEGAPAFAVEILSPTSPLEECNFKVQEYLKHGTSEAWLLDSSNYTIAVFHPHQTPKIFSRDQTVECTGALAGFRISLNDVLPE